MSTRVPGNRLVKSAANASETAARASHTTIPVFPPLSAMVLENRLWAMGDPIRPSPMKLTELERVDAGVRLDSAWTRRRAEGRMICLQRVYCYARGRRQR